MRRKNLKVSEIREALRALVCDIEGMYEGAEPSAEHGQPEEFFGPFSVGKLGDVGHVADISVSWPYLAISLRNAKDVLRETDADDVSARTS
jgi:hypothetical protein